MKINRWWSTVSDAAKCHVFFSKYKEHFDSTTSHKNITIEELQLLYELHFNRCSKEQAIANIQIEMMFDNYIV